MAYFLWAKLSPEEGPWIITGYWVMSRTCTWCCSPVLKNLWPRNSKYKPFDLGQLQEATVGLLNLSDWTEVVLHTHTPFMCLVCAAADLPVNDRCWKGPWALWPHECLCCGVKQHRKGKSDKAVDFHNPQAPFWTRWSLSWEVPGLSVSHVHISLGNCGD